ncbi:MAG: hypothetical protein WCF10_12995, partial [Polyangiales bacterium]
MRGKVKPENTSSQTEGSEREPYEAPRIVYREPLEAVATTCLPTPPAKGTPGSCPLGPIAS